MSEQNQEVMGRSENSENTEKAVLAGLSAGSLRFSEYYAVTNNAARSSILAGFHRDYGTQLLRDDRIQSAIQHYREVLAESTLYTPAKLTAQWARQASFKPSQLLNDDWSVKNLNELPNEVKAHFDEALINFEVIEKSGSRTIKPKFAKIEAQEHLGRIMRLYESDKEKAQGIVLNITLGGTESADNPGEQLKDVIGNINITQDEP